MSNIALALLRGYMTKFKTVYWDNYAIRLLHDKDDMRRIINFIPSFWDDDVNYTLALRPKKNTNIIDETWQYEWRLLDLDGNQIKEGKNALDIRRTNLFRRIFGQYWILGRRRAIVLGNLAPNRNYIVRVKLKNEIGETIEKEMAYFSTKDRGDFFMNIFLILFSIMAALFFSMVSRGCGL